MVLIYIYIFFSVVSTLVEVHMTILEHMHIQVKVNEMQKKKMSDLFRYV